MGKNEAILKKVLGRNIAKQRELKNITQEKLAEKIGISTSSLSEIECGRAYPRAKVLAEIAKILDITYDMLFKDSNIPENTEKDFQKRYELIKNNPEKFNVLYSVLKIIS